MDNKSQETWISAIIGLLVWIFFLVKWSENHCYFMNEKKLLIGVRYTFIGKVQLLRHAIESGWEIPAKENWISEELRPYEPIEPICEEDFQTQCMIYPSLLGYQDYKPYYTFFVEEWIDTRTITAFSHGLHTPANMLRDGERYVDEKWDYALHFGGDNPIVVNVSKAEYESYEDLVGSYVCTSH